MRGNFEDEGVRNQTPESEYGQPVRVFDRRRRRCAAGSRLIVAIFLIAAGTLLFLNNIGLLPVRNIWAYWPLVFVAIGISKLAGSHGPLGRAWGTILALGGAVILACNLGFLQVRDDIVWPLILVAVGVLLLMHASASRGETRSVGFPIGSLAISDNILRDWAVFGNVKRKLETENFQGGEAMSVFGSVEIDLRRARISSPAKSAIIEANALFGGVKIRIPENWRINVKGVGILGGYEDKTIPPRADSDAPTVVITGYAVFGGVQIED